MQTAGFSDDIGTRSQIKVVGVAEYYLRLDISAQLTLGNRLDGTMCANWHKNGGFDSAMVGSEYAAAGFRTL